MKIQKSSLIRVYFTIAATLAVVLMIGINSISKKSLVEAATSSTSVTVSNAAPSVDTVVLNSGGAITLSEGTTTNISVTGTVSDGNSCQDIDTVTVDVYRSGVGAASCDTNGEDNDNNCYAVVSCSISGPSCTGSSDPDATFSCTVAIQYHAENTVADTYVTENWLATALVTDNGALTDSTTSTGVELNETVGIGLTAAINYGTLADGSDTGTLNQSTVVTATGNVGLDSDVSGADMTCSTAGTCGVSTIAVGQQEYALSAVAYGSGVDLSTTPTDFQLNLSKTTNNLSPSTVSIYWGLSIPSSQDPGTYTGTNTVAGKKNT